MSRSNRSRRNRGQIIQNSMVPVTINGVSALIDTSTIPQKSWNHRHGSTKAGTQVNSLKTYEIGDNVLLQTDNGFIASFNKDELEVAARQMFADGSNSST